ncbi:MAG: ATP-dependent DNA helicase RecG [bacterium]|nr:ATP-dependent DNA helicase RecG [bacterium]
MPITLNTPITFLPRVGPIAAREFAKLGVRTARDLLFHFPFRHEDFSRLVSAAELKINETATVRCQVLVIKNSRSPRKRRVFTEAIFEDNSGSIKAIWFNQPYLPKLLHRGDWVLLSGKLEESYFGLHLTNPVFEKINQGETTIHAGRLVPIYHTSGNLTSRAIRVLLAQTLPLARDLTEWLPEEIRDRLHFPSLATAVTQIHFPKTIQRLATARERLAFNELFLAQIIAVHARQELDQMTAPAIPFNEAATKSFVQTLPFKLTDDQRKSAWQILQDMTKARPMNRLLEGEVGSGKTVVAAMAILNTALAGYNTAYLAPTEILAAQHAVTLRELLKGFGTRIGLLTQSIQEVDGQPIIRGALEQMIEAGEITCLIGTHALLQEKSKSLKTGLVIVDEQHRFGVEQRKKLRDKNNDQAIPHLLSMTATPIPRTLALTVYGDLDLSMLHELPRGRQPITTHLVTESERSKTYEAIRRELAAGRQAFVICPLISESDKLGVRAATKEHQLLSEIFKEFKVGLLHGKLKSDQKTQTMKDFKEGRLALLVATAVVEVGIDVPNATIMIIEGAERFGLAQLHQFRGRIGRGNEAARCYLFIENNTSEVNLRLLAFSKIHNGFALAEKDLELRGPGQFFGTAQSGFPHFQIADFHNIELLETARREAVELLKNDPELADHPLLRDYFSDYSKEIHLE